MNAPERAPFAAAPTAILPDQWPDLHVWHRAVPEDPYYPRGR